MEEGPVQYHPHNVPVTKTSLCIGETFAFLPHSDYSSDDDVNQIVQRSNSASEISEFQVKRPQEKNQLKNKEIGGLKQVIVEENGDDYRIITSVINPEDSEEENGLEIGFPGQSSNQVNLTQSSSKEASHKSKGEYKIVTMVTNTDLKQCSEENSDQNCKQSSRKDFTTVGKTDDSAEEFTIITSVDNTRPIQDCEDAKDNTEIDGSMVQFRDKADGETQHGRVSTWRQNQKIVSDAFNFLREVEDMDGRVFILDVQDKLEEEAKVPEKYRSGDDLPKNQILKRGNAIDVQENNEQNDDNMRDIPNTDQNRSGSIYESCSVNSTLSKSSKSSGSQSNMSESTSMEGLNGSNGVVKRQLKRNTVSKSQEEEGEEDEENSSDDDTGVYRESYRKSTWLYVGEDISKRIPSLVSEDGGIGESGYTSMASIEGQLSGADEVFNNDPMSPHRFNHRRNDSTATTASEAEFRKEYSTVRKCYVQRSDSQQQYHRMSHKFYEQERTYVLRKDSTDTGFGLHILNDNPAIITGINPGSPAAEAGVQTGQIIVSVNKVIVLRCSHAEIIQLMQEDGKQLELGVANSNIDTVRDLQMPVMTGTLSKLSSSSILRSWKKRFFILRQDNCLYCYKTQQDKDPLAAIPLTGYVISRHGDLNKNCFKADKYGSKTYYFMADVRETMTSWVGAMNEASQRGKERKDSWLDVTSVNVQLPALDIRQPDCSGWLYKLARSSRHWIRRYSVLKDACIYFYKTLNSTEARGVVHLHGYMVDFGLVGNRKYSFSLKPPEQQMRTFSFYTENETDRQRWIDAFQKSILKWVKVD